MTTYRRLFKPPKGSFFLMGARGTGKSTLLRATFPKAHFVDLLDERRYQQFLAQPGDFYDELSVLPARSTVVVDEVQRLPNLLNEVHRLIESHRLRFILSGSSARKLRRAGVNLLAGRALLRTMHPFVPEELGTDFKLETALYQGMLPLVWDAAEPEETLDAWVKLYLQAEIQAEALVRNLSGFARFLPVAALCHAQPLNISGIAQQAEVSRTTVTGFFEILEDTLLGFRLPAYQAKLRLRERKKPKFYFIDSGIVRTLQQSARVTVTPELGGHLFEGFVAQLLRAYRDYRDLFDEMFYWSPVDSKVEVDFLLVRGKQLIAIEAKSATRLRPEDYRGLDAIKVLPAVSRRILVYGGRTPRQRDGIEILPFGSFLKLLQTGSI